MATARWALNKQGVVTMQSEPYTLTKMDVAALRHADYLFVRLERDTPTVRITKRVEKTEKNPFAQDIDYYIDAAVRLAYLYRQETKDARCNALVYLYHNQATPASSVVHTFTRCNSDRPTT